MKKRILCRFMAAVLGAVCLMTELPTDARAASPQAAVLAASETDAAARENIETQADKDTPAETINLSETPQADIPQTSQQSAEVTLEENAGQPVSPEQASSDNTFPAKTSGVYYIQAVYQGGSRNGQADLYRMEVSNINTSLSISTLRSVKVVAAYKGNAGNSLISNMSHIPSSDHAALYEDAGKNKHSYMYAAFHLNVPKGYKIASVTYAGQGTRGTYYHLYLDNANLKFDSTAGVKTWSSATANLLTEACSPDGEARIIAVRSMVDIFYNAGVGTTNATYANAHGNVKQSVYVTPITYTIVYDAAGGVGAPAAQNIVYDTPVTLTAEAPSRSGYVFAGWNIGGVTYGSGQTLTEQQVNAIAYLQGQQVVATAVWEPIRYSISYDGNGATEGSTANQDSLIYDVEYHLQPNGYKRQFHISYDVDGGTLEHVTDLVAANFLGWRIVRSGESALFENTAVFKNMTDKAQAVTLYAQWDDEPLYITLPDPVKASKTVTAKNEAGEDGYLTTVYEFLGWKEKEAADEAPYLGKELYVTRDLELVAHWKETVSFSQTPVAGNTTEQIVENQTGQIINKLEELEAKLTNSYNLSDEQAEKILEAIENGSSFKLNMGGTEYTIVRNPDGTLSIQLASIPAGTKRVVIPSEVKIGNHVYPITEIHQGCFKDNKDLKEVEIGNNIVKIGDEAFSGCSSLEKATLAQGLISIGNRAFQGCAKLTSVKLPTTLLTIGQYAFYKCSGLKKIRIPDSVLKVGKYAFGSCAGMKKAVCSKNCATMGEGVFSACKALEKVTLKAALTEVPARAFQNCKKLSSVTIPKKVMAVKTRAFYRCSALKTVKLKTKHLTTVGKEAFKKCKKGIRFTVPMKKKKEYAKLLKGNY